MARTWGRKQILEPLLEVLEMLGVDLPPKGAEVLMRSDEEDMVQYISDNMPYDFQESFEDVMPQLVEAVGYLTNLRQSLEADDADAVVATMEAAFESQPLTATAALRHAVEHAATEVARVRSCHTTWKASTEARIYRLENAKDEAEKATQDYLVVEAKLANFRGQTSDKSRACLMGMAEGSSKATLASCFASWRGTTEEGKVQQDLRDKYEAQLAEMQQQVLQYQALRLQNVRNAMARTVLENSDTILNTLFQTWVADTAQCIKMREGNRQLDDARLQLAAVARSRAASGRKIVAQMLEESRLGPLVMCYQAWTQFLETERREHATEENIRGLEKELKVLMDAKKAKLKNVLTSLVDGQTEDLLFEVVQAWVQASVEEPIETGASLPQRCAPQRPQPRRAAAAVALVLPLSRSFRRRAERCRRRVASIDEAPPKVKARVRALRRPPAASMSKRTALEKPPSLDYLESCLQSGHLEKADQITRDLLLAFAGPAALERGFAQPEEVQQMNPADLLAVDGLWVRHTQGRFGYSVQRGQWRAAGEDFNEFLQRVGWLQADPSGEQLLRFWPRREFDYSLNADEGPLSLVRGAEPLLEPETAERSAQAMFPLWHFKPKIHLLQEMAEDQSEDHGNPREFWCYRDESWITMITGFETFNARLYRAAARRAVEGVEGLSVCVFTDKDISERRDVVEEVLKETDVLFCSLVFDFDQAAWLKESCQSIEVRMVFESALELMSETKVGSFSMSGGGGGGMPPAVRSMISMLTGQREEDRIAGYTKFLKTGPKLLQFLPQFGPIPDLRRWLQSYALWSGGGGGNVASMLRYIASEFGGFEDLQAEEMEETTADVPPKALEVVEIPQVGLLHPALKFAFQPGPFFQTPREYMEWYRSYKPRAIEERWPVVAILLYRKHVVSELSYIFQLVNYFEENHQILPLPIFIQGVDAHIAVRDLLTSDFEKQAVASGAVPANRTLSPDAVHVDAVVNTIGFPLVGGPAGSMEGGRNSEIAKEILTSLNVPYFVAAPLLIQDVASWKDQGIGGLQGAVLYALPELDGAIDAVALGGLVAGGDIELLPDRVDRLAVRIRRWVALRRKPPQERKVAIVVYGYPPGIGATGTAALLNVPRSLKRLLEEMAEEGYDVGTLPEDAEELIREVTAGDQAAETGQSFGDAEESLRGAASVEVGTLASWLPKASQEAVEGAWGEGLAQSGIRTMGTRLLLGGRRQGKVWLAVQPPLGIPGDPMRLLFERDMTPHPQYVAFYKYIENELGADAVVHFGMHGTAEWLPGRPLGNLGSCWPDQLLGGLPHVYLYAANNPSESILAKRRGYGCLVSYNVPPYARAGLYKELQAVRGLLAELAERRDPDTEEEARLRSAAASVAGASADAPKSPRGDDAEPSLETAVIQAVISAGLQKDLPLPPAAQQVVATKLKSADIDAVAQEAAAKCSAEEFADYAGRLRFLLAQYAAPSRSRSFRHH
ncbi:bchH [Symbiodinium sp. CCMP2592]|nr:bchH [Symbiodinium sp. CCMP2592]